jgi:hypothetical protein
VIPVTVVVAFYSRCGSSETRALTAAVGAVQARALIRMRRMPDVNASPTPEEGSDCAENLARMQREYVPPTEADILGTDGLVVAAPGGSTAESAEWAPLVAILSKLKADGKVRGKVAGIVDGGDPAVVSAIADLLHGLGFIVVPPAAVDVPGPDIDGVERARAQGRLVAHLCRAFKAASS